MALTTCGETNIPVARTSSTESSLNAAVFDSKMAEILKLVFERTSKGARTIGSSPDNMRLTVLLGAEVGETEMVTISLTVAFIITELCAFTPAGTKTPTAMSVSRHLI
jgi:hypothetical protein